MIEVPLTQGLVAIIDDCDGPLILAHKWCAQKHVNAGVVNYYAVRTSYEGGRKQTVRMHCFIMGARTGLMVDHRNGNRLDNRRENLRFCTNGQNRSNSRKHAASHSRFKGVTKYLTRRAAKKPWHAQIVYGSKLYHLGSYATEIEAAMAYDARARVAFGEFAKLNFSSEVVCGTTALDGQPG